MSNNQLNEDPALQSLQSATPHSVQEDHCWYWSASTGFCVKSDCSIQSGATMRTPISSAAFTSAVLGLCCEMHTAGLCVPALARLSLALRFLDRLLLPWPLLWSSLMGSL